MNDKDACAWSALAELAKRQETSLSAVLSEAIEAYVADNGVKVECLTGTHFHRYNAPEENELRDLIGRAWRIVEGQK